MNDPLLFSWKFGLKIRSLREYAREYEEWNKMGMIIVTKCKLGTFRSN